jgi:hypothetical protein
MFNYSFNWNNVIKVLVPPVYRTTRHLEWMKAIFKPIITLYASFISYKDEKMYFAAVTFSKIHMEKMLNDQFDNIHRRIYIEDVTRLTNVFVANKVLGYPPVYVYNSSVTHDPLWVYSKSSYVAQLDFVVRVPASILAVINQNRMKALIGQYKFAGKRYQIQAI